MKFVGGRKLFGRDDSGIKMYGKGKIGRNPVKEEEVL